MKTLTKKQRLEAYIGALSYIENDIKRDGVYGMGFCFALCASLNEKGSNNSGYIYRRITSIFPELKQYKPKSCGSYWFNSDSSKDDDNKRINILKSIIKQLEKELKSKKK